MERFRVITVLEHELVPVVSDGDAAALALTASAGGDTAPWLTEPEATALLSFCDSGPRFCERTGGGVRFAQFCGVLRCGAFVLEILPKTGMNDARFPEEVGGARRALLHMLGTVRKVNLTAMGDVGQSVVHTPLLEVFIRAFLHCAIERARHGLLFRYLPRTDNLTVARGRFVVHGHLRENLARPHLLHCAFDEFTTDNPYNQAIRSTLDVCRPWLKTADGQHLWFEAHARFAEISSLRMKADDVASLPRDRTTRHYGATLDWCELLLDLLNPALRSGSANAPGLLFDMNRLFESYVLHLEQQAAKPELHVRAQGPERHLASFGTEAVFRLKPDVSVWRRGDGGELADVVRIADAKWKRLDPRFSRWSVAEADVYQLLAYAIRYHCTALELVYPEPDNFAAGLTPPVFTIDTALLAAPVTIRVRLVRLAGDQAQRLTEAVAM